MRKGQLIDAIKSAQGGQGSLSGATAPPRTNGDHPPREQAANSDVAAAPSTTFSSRRRARSTSGARSPSRVVREATRRQPAGAVRRHGARRGQRDGRQNDRRDRATTGTSPRIATDQNRDNQGRAATTRRARAGGQPGPGKRQPEPRQPGAGQPGRRAATTNRQNRDNQNRDQQNRGAGLGRRRRQPSWPAAAQPGPAEPPQSRRTGTMERLRVRADGLRGRRAGTGARDPRRSGQLRVRPHRAATCPATTTRTSRCRWSRSSACARATWSPASSARRATASARRSSTRWSGWRPSTAAIRSWRRTGPSSAS